MKFSLTGIPFAPIVYTSGSKFNDFQNFLKEIELDPTYHSSGIIKVKLAGN